MVFEWPEFDENGDLPVRLHRTTLAEVLSHFGSSTLQRRIVAERLEKIYKLVRQTGQLHRFVIFGSFVTSKPNPQDVDIFLLMDDTFEVGGVSGEAAILFDHMLAETGVGASIFWIRRVAAIDGEQTAVEYWQIKRDRTMRGIVEVVDHDQE